MLIGGVVHHQFGDHPQASCVCFLDEAPYVGQSSILGMHIPILGNVVAIVTARRRVEGQQPNRVNTQSGYVVQLLNQSRKVPFTVIIRVEERFDVQLVDDSVLVPAGLIEHPLGGAILQTHSEVPSSSTRAHITKGRSGVNSTYCPRPWTRKRRSSNKSCRVSELSSGSPHSCSGNSSRPACRWCGARLTATITMLSPSSLCVEKNTSRSIST